MWPLNSQKNQPTPLGYRAMKRVPCYNPEGGLGIGASSIPPRWNNDKILPKNQDSPQKWRHFEDLNTPLRHTGSFTLPLEGPCGFLGLFS